MMMLQYIIGAVFISGAIRPDNGAHSYCITHQSPSLMAASRSSGQRYPRRPSMLQLRRVVRSWQPTMTSSQLSLSGSFYDDFEDFGEFGSNESSDDGDDGEKIKGSGEEEISKSESAAGGDSADAVGANDDAVMMELRKRMNDLSNQDDEEEEEEDEEEDDEEEDDDDVDSGSALPDLEGNTLSSIDDLIGFAQAKAREKANKDTKDSDKTTSVGGTWEDENWAKPVPRVDEDSGDMLDLSDILEGGVVLIANPAKFCSDLASSDDKQPEGKKKDNSFLAGLFDDPFPNSPSSESPFSNSISPALLAKFGITLPPSPDLGPDRRADLLPVVILLDRDDVRGCQAVLMNRRTGNLMGDLPTSLFETADVDNDAADDESGYTPHPLSAFMIQPLWWAGSSPGGNSVGDEEPNRGGGIKAIDMVHACPYVNGSVPLEQSDGLYWGGSPVQAQEAMKDARLEKPLSGFDFKFFIQTTRWLPSQLEQEIEEGVWYVANVSKEVLFRSRDRLGAKRAKPLWTEVIELLGDDYKHIRDQLYGEED